MNQSSNKPPADSPSEPEILVFCGSFDPPHQGHFDMAAAALARFPAARLLIVPSPVPAAAGGGNKVTAAAFPDRLEMCRLNFAAFATRAAVTDLEWLLPKPNRTIKTVTAIAGSGSTAGKRLGLVLGGDQLADFARWFEPLAIMRLASLVVLPRAALPDAAGSGSPTPLAAAMDLAGALNLETRMSGGDRLEFADSQVKPVFLLTTTPAGAASRAIRAAFAAKTLIPNGWLRPEVRTYLEQKQLYQTPALSE